MKMQGVGVEELNLGGTTDRIIKLNTDAGVVGVRCVSFGMIFRDARGELLACAVKRVLGD
jgi:hypothetical protein